MELSILFDRFPRLVLGSVSCRAFKIGGFRIETYFLTRGIKEKNRQKNNECS